jgi:hypothetical protein
MAATFECAPSGDDTETRGPRGLWKSDVRGVVEVILGEHLPKLTRREEVPKKIKPPVALALALEHVCVGVGEVGVGEVAEC